MPTEFGDSFDEYAAGREAMNSSDYARAIKLFEESIRLSPHFKTLELLGECRLKIHQPSEAIVPLAAAVGLGTNAFRAMYLLAQAFSECGDKKTALKYVERALQMNSEFRQARDLKDLLESV